MADCPHRVDHRCTSARAAIVLVHGFGGNAEATWGLFPELLKKEPRLQNWDVFSLGYSTSLAFDLAGVWSADPEIITLGGLIQTVTDVAPLDRYGSLAILAHSMGGLLVQRALLSNAARGRVCRICCCSGRRAPGWRGRHHFNSGSDRCATRTRGPWRSGLCRNKSRRCISRPSVPPI